LTHLYVLLPVLDNSKHYFVASGEIEKLLDHGGQWLSSHPERELIVRRYLRYKRPLVTSALVRLSEDESSEDNSDDDGTVDVAQSETEHELGLHEQRLQAVIAAVREAGAHSLVDLGCGEG